MLMLIINHDINCQKIVLLSNCDSIFYLKLATPWWMIIFTLVSFSVVRYLSSWGDLNMQISVQINSSTPFLKVRNWISFLGDFKYKRWSCITGKFMVKLIRISSYAPVRCSINQLLFCFLPPRIDPFGPLVSFWAYLGDSHVVLR